MNTGCILIVIGAIFSTVKKNVSSLCQENTLRDVKYHPNANSRGLNLILKFRCV